MGTLLLLSSFCFSVSPARRRICGVWGRVISGIGSHGAGGYRITDTHARTHACPVNQMHNSISGTMRKMLLFAALLRVVVMMQQATTRPAPEKVEKGADVCLVVVVAVVAVGGGSGGWGDSFYWSQGNGEQGVVFERIQKFPEHLLLLLLPPYPSPSPSPIPRHPILPHSLYLLRLEHSSTGSTSS
jgi:hypothetical protein